MNPSTIQSLAPKKILMKPPSNMNAIPQMQMMTNFNQVPVPNLAPHQPFAPPVPGPYRQQVEK